eukprot:TRINITY_DN84167_c0_g1_i1.p1 TRINITY_DN84167_c0_g1~~TRINITY_DN84167_c0_g1_i1.p1  ORF type:complete len:472 (-),score=90.47 TRINITY_DN84167_c0_g1_i1:27-1421(-)
MAFVQRHRLEEFKAPSRVNDSSTVVTLVEDKAKLHCEQSGIQLELHRLGLMAMEVQGHSAKLCEMRLSAGPGGTDPELLHSAATETGEIQQLLLNELNRLKAAQKSMERKRLHLLQSENQLQTWTFDDLDDTRARVRSHGLPELGCPPVKPGGTDPSQSLSTSYTSPPAARATRYADNSSTIVEQPHYPSLSPSYPSSSPSKPTASPSTSPLPAAELQASRPAALDASDLSPVAEPLKDRRSSEVGRMLKDLEREIDALPRQAVPLCPGASLIQAAATEASQITGDFQRLQDLQRLVEQLRIKLSQAELGMISPHTAELLASPVDRLPERDTSAGSGKLLISSEIERLKMLKAVLQKLGSQEPLPDVDDFPSIAWDSQPSRGGEIWKALNLPAGRPLRRSSSLTSLRPRTCNCGRGRVWSFLRDSRETSREMDCYIQRQRRFLDKETSYFYRIFKPTCGTCDAY